MGISTWLKENRLSRIHSKLKALRSRQSTLREQAEELARERKRGGNAAELDRKEAKLHEERERVTAEVARLHDEEERLKRELKAEGVPAR